MSNFDVFFQQLIERDMKFVEALLGPTEEVSRAIREHLQKEKKKREKCLKNGQLYIADLKKIEELAIRREQAAKLSAQLISEFDEVPTPAVNYGKENSLVSSETLLLSSSSASTTNSRPKRAAFREASQMINKHVNMKLNDKLRREDTTSLNMNLKTEKLSITLKDTVDSTNNNNDDDDMPPPKNLPIKKSNRRIKREQLEISTILEDEEIVDGNNIEINRRGSDIILHEPRISSVDLTLTTNFKTNDNSTRGTYVLDKSTNKKQSSEKRNRDTLDENIEKSLNKRSKTNSNLDVDNKNDSVQTHYDNAVSNSEDVEQLNVTFVATSSINKNINQLLNISAVVEKEQQAVMIPDSLLTDDDSNQEQKSKYNSKQSKTSKQGSLDKNKVEAFEKLGTSASVPVRVTRTKTKALEQQHEQHEKPKQQASFSPISLNIKQQTINKAQTTMKTNAEENRQKAIVAIEKRNARVQQLMEERRRKREEKELKAQQQRADLEREKLKQLEELEKLKSERHQRLLFEQKQKKIKLHEEAERKRLLVKEKALKEKEKKQPTIEKAKYLTMQAPRLPTYDCYDSDEEDYRGKIILIPDWCQEKNLCWFQYIMSYAGEKIKNTFFSRQVQTVDLQDLFQINNPRVLKRSSSAHWAKPPKYSILPTHFENSLEISDALLEEEEEEVEED